MHFYFRSEERADVLSRHNQVVHGHKIAHELDNQALGKERPSV
jgi:hypothetical protein